LKLRVKAISSSRHPLISAADIEDRGDIARRSTKFLYRDIQKYKQVNRNAKPVDISLERLPVRLD
jgi:hypothetical protein